MIQVYPLEPSIAAGDKLLLRVRGIEDAMVVRVYRWTTELERLGEWGPFRDDVVRIVTSPEWPSGAYIAQCCAPSAPELRFPDAREGAALFVLRAQRAHVVMNLPLFTYHAYNCVENGGDCLYTGPKTVSLHRAGGGIGGHPWDEMHADVYDPRSPRQTFAHWDAKALGWLCARGYDPAVCCDLDLDAGRLPEEARLVLAFGHFEYWTDSMRATIERFLRGGGNVALFSGNTSWFRVHYDPVGHVLSRYGKWSDVDGEENVIGTSYRFGGGCWRGARPATGFTVGDASHWAFAGTGLSNGDVFGAEKALVGYEFDGAPNLAHEIAFASARDWNIDPDNGELMGGRASMVARPIGDGVLFNAATVDWARVMQNDVLVSTITDNVVQRLLAFAYS
jgi:hypothetical protein